MGFSKAFLVGLNVLFLALGAALIGIGVYAYKVPGSVSQLDSVSISIGLIVLGCFVVVLSFFGCCGAAGESKFMLGLYFFILLILVLACIGVAVGAVTHKSSLDDSLRKAWVATDNATKEVLQEDFHCCGWMSPSDHPAYGSSASCNQDHLVGCEPFVEDYLKKRIKIVEIFGFAVGATMILGLVCSMYMIRKIPTEQERRDRLLNEARRLNRQYY